MIRPFASGSSCATIGSIEGSGDQIMGTHFILLIDDDRTWSEAVTDLLRAEGFEVETAGDGRCGLELLERTSPDLVILDVHMPRLGGFEVLRELRRHRQVPILMVSGVEQADIVAKALAEGATCFLHKPVAAELLLRAVRRLLEPPGRGGRGSGTLFRHH